MVRLPFLFLFFVFLDKGNILHAKFKQFHSKAIIQKHIEPDKVAL